jgi:L-ascorbate metabolism protein UlaG (beta-lactamase superfamily)
VEISFLGMNCVRITGKDIAILVDPIAGSELKQSNDVTLLSQVTTNLPSKTGIVIDSPGEYEVKGSMITGAPARLHIDPEEQGQQGTIYSVNVEGINVAVLGNIAPELKDDQVEALGAVDVLVLPVGNHGLTLDAQAAAAIISQLEPKYVVPTHFDDGKSKFEVSQDKVDSFLKETGSTVEPQAKLRVSTRDLPAETTVVVLQRQGS